MQQRDLILREIEKIGVVVRAILNKLQGKSAEAVEQEQAVVHHSSYLKEQLNLDIAFLTEATMDEVEHKLTYDKGYNAENFELLGDLLSQLSASSPAEDEIILQKRALDLYGLAVKLDKAYAFGREEKIDRIKNNLKS